MKAILFYLLLANITVVAQDLATTTVSADTLPKTDTIRVSPYVMPATSRSLGNFAVISKDKYAFETAAGFSVLNTLRGHTPNLQMGPNYTNAAGGIRSGSSMMVIDGLPFAMNYWPYYNLNAFEFESIAALSSGSAASVYGGMAYNGAFILESKSGRDVSKPTIEFNSASSISWYETEGSYFFPGVKESVNQWQLNNAIAFMKDFGPVDTRVSYTYGFQPDGSGPGDSRADNHAVKINTGAQIGSRFEARLILDHYSSTNESIYNAGPLYTLHKNYIGNLLLTYKISDWLTISSQGSLSRLDRTVEMVVNKTDQEQNRKFANVFLSFQKSLGAKVGLSAFSGVQYEKNKAEQFDQIGMSTGTSMQEYSTKTWSAGAGAQFVDALFIDFNYRRDYFSLLPSDDNSRATYSLSSAFNILDAFHLGSHAFSGVRVRGSYGKTFFAIQQGFPFQTSMVSQTPNEKVTHEAGLDVSFFEDRITLGTTYFSTSEHVTAVLFVPGNTGFVYTVVNLGDLHVAGGEVVLACESVRQNNVSMNTKLIWSDYNGDLKLSGEIEPTPGSPAIGSSYPDWRGSLLNQLSIGRFFTTFLVDVQEGGLTATMDYTSGTPMLTYVDASHARMREFSIGYTLLRTRDYQRNRRAQISLSFRNLFCFNSGSNLNIEYGSTVQKSANLNLSFTL